MSEQIDAKTNNLGQSDDEIIAEVKKSVDASLSEDKKGNWRAEIQRDIYGKLISVNVNLPDNVTENEKANAVNAINQNRGVANVDIYPITLIDQDMELLTVGTKILPDFYVLSGDDIVEGITEDEAKSGVKSFSGAFSNAPASISHAYDLSSSVLKNILLELFVKCPSGVETEGRFNIGSSQVPIYMSIEKSDTWIEKASRLETPTDIRSLVVYNNKLYGAIAPGLKLYEWDGVDAWVEVAGQVGTESNIYALAVYNNKLYGGTHPHGKLYEWNGVDAWVEVAGWLGTERVIIWSLVVYNNKLYAGLGGTYGGQLYEWNGVDAWVEVASRLGAENDIQSLAVYNNKLYAGTYPGGKLLEWNGVDAWVEIVSQVGTGTGIPSLAVYNNKLYGGSNIKAKLYEWDGVDTWVEVAGQLGEESGIHSLAVYNNKLYGGTHYNGKLYEWNGVDAWVEVAGLIATGKRAIRSLVVYNNKLYGGSMLGGKLLEYTPDFKFHIPNLTEPNTTLKLDIPDTSKWYKFVMEIVGDNHARIEVQDELSNVILSSEGDFIPYSGVENSIVIAYNRYVADNPFAIYIDDLKISQTAR